MDKNTIFTTLFKFSFYPLLLVATYFGTMVLLRSFQEGFYALIPLVTSLVAVVLFIIFERLAPYQREWNDGRGDFLTDLIRTFLTLPLASKLSEVLLPVLIYFPLSWISSGTEFGLLSKDMPLFPAFIITLLASEFLFYWIHRISHNNPLLWRFHAVHHGAERMYWANSGRFHFVDAFLTAFSYSIPVLVFGVGTDVVVMLVTFSAISGFMEHVNINFKAGFLNYIFNTAEVHRWHHSEKMEESNNNFGKVLIIWDLVFGTYFKPKNKTVESIGIEGEVVPNCFFKQLKYPFKRALK